MQNKKLKFGTEVWVRINQQTFINDEVLYHGQLAKVIDIHDDGNTRDGLCVIIPGRPKLRIKQEG